MKDFLAKRIYNKKFRAKIYQILLLVFLVVFFLSIFQNTLSAIQSRGITTGFSFFQQTAGFSITQTLIEYSSKSSYADAFIVGLLNTIVISVIGIFLTTILGFIIGVARLSKNFLVAKISATYVEVFRNIPLLLQIFFWYNAVLKPLPGPRDLYSKGETVAFSVNNRGLYLPKLELEAGFSLVFWFFALALVLIFFVWRYTVKLKKETGKEFPFLISFFALFFGLPALGIGLATLFYSFPFSLSYSEMATYELKGGFTIIPEFISLLIALVIYTASFIAEIVRAGIQSVNYGQTEAAYCCGLNKIKTLRFVLIPQAMRVIIPPLISQYLNLTKNSSLAAAIAYPDIVSVFAGTVLNQTGQALEIIAITMGIYLLLSLITSLFLNWYNQQRILKER